MSGQQVAQVFGPNMPTRIAGTAQLVLEPGEVAPSLPWYQPLVPFYPPNISSGGASSSSTTADGHRIWESSPSRCDLLFYQGDDVVIPLFFNDPATVGDDLSAYKWVSQIRVLHRYQSRLVGEFLTTAEFHPDSDPDDDWDDEYTKVELFLPRDQNTCYGQFRWDLYSIAEADMSRFPTPQPLIDPPLDPLYTDLLRTWLYGIVTISPRVTSTDVLLDGSGGGVHLPWPGPPPDVTVITTGGWTVGPNGRVP